MSISPGINNSHNNSIPLKTVKTSKAWVLPPRPKPGRKPTSEKVEICKEKKRRPRSNATIIEEKSTLTLPQQIQLPIQSKNKQQIMGSQHPSKCSISKQQKQQKSPACVSKSEVHELNKNLSIIEKENNQLKTHLLSLIHDYKHLKNLVLNKPQSLPQHLAFEDKTTTARKRSFTELVNIDPMNELICNMSDLSYSPVTTGASNVEPSSPIEDTDSELDEVFNYINLDSHIHDEDEDEDIESLELSRTTSPSVMSEPDGENSLMTTLTRSTTVSTNNSMMNDKKTHKDEQFKFYSLPEFSTKDYQFSFDEINQNDKKMTIIQEDKYNMIADFLEEKLIDNDLNYYVQNESFKH